MTTIPCPECGKPATIADFGNQSGFRIGDMFCNNLNCDNEDVVAHFTDHSTHLNEYTTTKEPTMSTLNDTVESFFAEIGLLLMSESRRDGNGEYREVLPQAVKVIGQYSGFNRRLVLTRNGQRLDVFLYNGATIRVANQLFDNGPTTVVDFSADTLSNTIAAFVVSRFAKLEG